MGDGPSPARDGRFVTHVLYNVLAINGVTFVLGGIIILMIERSRPRATVHDVDRTPVGKAFGIGVAQAVAIVPGVSRSGATIVGGLALGLDRSVATEFSTRSTLSTESTERVPSPAPPPSQRLLRLRLLPPHFSKFSIPHNLETV